MCCYHTIRGWIQTCVAVSIPHLPQKEGSRPWLKALTAWDSGENRWYQGKGMKRAGWMICDVVCCDDIATFVHTCNNANRSVKIQSLAVCRWLLGFFLCRASDSLRDPPSLPTRSFTGSRLQIQLAFSPSPPHIYSSCHASTLDSSRKQIDSRPDLSARWSSS